MSYMQFQQKCEDCGEQWNAAFGVVGTTQIASPPPRCPKCGSTSLVKVAGGWAGQSLHATISSHCQGCAEAARIIQRERALSDQLAAALKMLWKESIGHLMHANLIDSTKAALAQHAAARGEPNAPSM